MQVSLTRVENTKDVMSRLCLNTVILNGKSASMRGNKISGKLTHLIHFSLIRRMGWLPRCPYFRDQQHSQTLTKEIDYEVLQSTGHGAGRARSQSNTVVPMHIHDATYYNSLIHHVLVSARFSQLYYEARLLDSHDCGGLRTGEAIVPGCSLHCTFAKRLTPRRPRIWPVGLDDTRIA
jgi:hypothetical protein